MPNVRNGTFKATDLVSIIVKAINAYKVVPSPNDIYIIIFRGEFVVTSSIGEWGPEWCGFHSGFNLIGSKYYYKYIAIGDPSTSQYYDRCEQILGDTVNHNVGADSLLSVYAHEVGEVVTNPYVGSINNAASLKTGWVFNPAFTELCYGGSPCENGDVCAWNFCPPDQDCISNAVVGEKQFLLQLMWQPGG